MRLPIEKMSKQQIVEAYRWRCPEHRGHNGLEHPNCYLKHALSGWREGYFDIEASQLKGNWGVVLSWCIKERGKNIYHFDYLKPEDFEAKSDARVIKTLVETLSRFNLIYTYYGTRFDITFSRTRALKHSLFFPPYRSIIHIDLYYVARSRLNLHSNRLEYVAELLGVKGKTKLTPEVWCAALFGDQEAMEYVVDHNKRDCLILEKVHQRLEPYMAEVRRSI